MGDWGPVIRDPIDLLRLNFLVGAAVFAASGDITQSLRFGLAFAVVLVARSLDVPRPFDFGLVIAMAISVWGGPLGLFEEFRWYDEVLHTFTSFFGAPLLYILLVRLDALPELQGAAPPRHRYVGILLASFALGLSVGALLEVWEWAANHWFGAHNLIGYGDTIADIVINALASLGGGGMLLIWAEYGWGTSRRARGASPRERERSAEAA